ncbi:hypothetical protein [Amycolatopsis plumensis]|uniref:hypothetical protein n=1 Tax=Amycolatopsis plumensis TaxID=236508 RepID=UPI00360FF24A
MLVFVPQPRWATGEARPGSTAPRATEPPPAEWPSEELVVGLPDGDSYAVGLIGARRGGGKNTVTRPPRPPVASSP